LRWEGGRAAMGRKRGLVNERILARPARIAKRGKEKREM
jgi:hypothetical protein